MNIPYKNYIILFALVLVLNAMISLFPNPVKADPASELLAKWIGQFYITVIKPAANARASRSMEGSAMIADKQNEQAVELHNARTAFEMEAPVSECALPEIAHVIGTEDEINKITTKTIGGHLMKINTETDNSLTYQADIVAAYEKKRGKKTDLAAWNLFDSDQYDKAELKSALAYIANVTNPIPTQQLPDDVKNSPVSIPAKNIMISEAKKLSLAQQSLIQVAIDRLPNKAAGKILGKKNGSIQELHKHIVNKRIGNAEWVQNTLDSPPYAAIKDLTIMMAYRIKQEEMQYHQNQRMEALLAVMLAQQTKEWSNKKLEQLNQKVARAADGS